MTRTIGLLPGDPGGVGPEIVARLLAADMPAGVRPLLIGDPHVFALGQRQAGTTQALVPCDARRGALPDPVAGTYALHALDTIAPADLAIGQTSRPGGRSVLRTLAAALDLWRAGRIDALVFAPFNKTALHLAGMTQEGEGQWIAEALGVTGHVSELNTLGALWTARVTSHIPLRAVADAITGDGIHAAARLVHDTLVGAGRPRPRIAVAALNPHAGDGGNYGREEIEVIGPAVQALAATGMDIIGPLPSDTVFLAAQRGAVDAVVTMYHDQGQIALKLLGFDRGVTVHGGLPLPVTTPAHGSAFDIAGKGQADPGPLRAAFALAGDLAGDLAVARDMGIAEASTG